MSGVALATIVVYENEVVAAWRSASRVITWLSDYKKLA
jgi:hypothetical protein